ncbi:MAG: hypothetical protein K6B52_05485 [Clostridiales bacterium]|nr:hypothetical protein [Clostridiales bacterium]
MFKKTVSVVICIVTLLSTIIIPCYSFKYDDGIGALRSQWKSGEGPEINGFNIDYSYYVPESENPCPLMIFMGGVGNGTHKGKELNATDFPFWSSEEFQSAAVNADGMYLMILRSPLPFYFDTCPLKAMFEAIRDFVDTHNVDKKRICLFGRCLGASGVHRLASHYPDYFSGACYMCPRTIIGPISAKKMKNTKIWIFISYLDTYSLFPLFALPSWINASLYTSNKENVRLTTCLFAPIGGIILNHEVYHLLEKNFTHEVEKDYVLLKTKDATGQKITDLDAIRFFTSGDYTPATDKNDENNESTIDTI